jgi:predicted alpha/beta hydrolase
MSRDPTELTLHAYDGVALAVTEFGDLEAAHAAVLLVGGMGIPQRYYARFAAWLAGHGYWVVTFDYRGMGRSRPPEFARSLRGFDASVTTWATRDVPAVVDHVRARAGARPLLWIGHSLGGQILGLVPNRHYVTAMLTVATGSGYWRENTVPVRWFVWWIWYVVAPLAVRFWGYFPGGKLRKIGDLPAGVMTQWRRWCLDPSYVAGVEGPDVRAAYAELRVPVAALSFTDDEYMSARSTESLHGLYGEAWRSHRRVAPKEVGVNRIGHFGFFGRRFADSLWPIARDWLRGHH